MLQTKPRPRAGLLTCGYLLLALVGLVHSGPAHAQGTQGGTVCEIGTEIENLFDLDALDETFGISLWIWATCPDSDLAVLDSIEFLTARPDLILSPVSRTILDDGRVYETRRVQGHFQEEWDLKHYPFDRNVLEIPFEEYEFEADQVGFAPDLDSSFIAPEVRGEQGEWTASDLTITTTVRAYGSSFSADQDGSHYASGVISLELNRWQGWTFVKLTLGVFAASVLSFLAFFLDPRIVSAYTAQLGVLTGGLFAILLNMRAAETTIGTRAQLTLVTEVHLVALALVVLVAVIVVAQRRRAERGLNVIYPHWTLFGSCVGIYLTINLVLVGYSMIVG